MFFTTETRTTASSQHKIKFHKIKELQIKNVEAPLTFIR